MEFKELEEFVTTVKNFNDYLDMLESYKINLIDNPIFDDFGRVCDLFLTTNFIDVGVDIINWYLYENDNIFNEELPYGEINTIEDLWDKVQQYLK